MTGVCKSRLIIKGVTGDGAHHVQHVISPLEMKKSKYFRATSQHSREQNTALLLNTKH